MSVPFSMILLRLCCYVVSFMLERSPRRPPRHPRGGRPSNNLHNGAKAQANC